MCDDSIKLNSPISINSKTEALSDKEKKYIEEELYEQDVNDVVIDDDIYSDFETELPESYNIVSYGADYTIDSLVTRMNRQDIYIPEFQRHFVWNKTKASRFIESLLLGLPVPGMFLTRIEDDGRMIVIDGQQRLKSLSYFYEGKFNDQTVFPLRNVHEKYNGKKYSDLEPIDRRKLDDSIIHVTIVRQEEPQNDKSSIYQLFERINTGGQVLQPQEIRNCIFMGSLNEYLFELNKNNSWRVLFGKEHTRMRDIELILRFFAFYFTREQYKKPLKGFLNAFMGNKKNIEEEEKNKWRSIFERTMNLILTEIGDKAFKPKNKFSASVFDSFAVAVAHSIEKTGDCIDLKKRYSLLLQKVEYQEAIEGATADEKNVNKRFDLALDALTISLT